MKNSSIGRKVLVHLLIFAIVASLLGVAIVVSAAPAPTISTVNPNQGVQGQTLASVVITGTNLDRITTVTFGAETTVNSFTIDSKTQITANVTIAHYAKPGSRDVTVNGSGGPATLTNGFTVNYAPPTVSSVSPNQEIQGQTINTTITGDYFSGATSVSFGLGVSVDSFTVDSMTQITAGITISSAATPGTRNVSVTNPGGTGTLTNGFTVNYAPPTISSVNPNVGVQEQTLDVTITGTYFTAATLVGFGSGITTNSYTVNSATQITANITISYSAAPGPRDVSVTTPGGTATFPDSFGVNQAPPSVVSTSPDHGMQEETMDIVVTGTHFTDATSVSFGEGITTNSFVVDSDTQITASITIAYDATPGLRDVSVTTGAGTGALASAFTVDQAPPGMSSVSPDQAIQGQTLDVIINGTHFTGASSVSFGAEIAINSFTVDNDTQITANITVDPNATPGFRDVSVTTPAGTVTYLFTVNQAPPTVSMVTPNQGIQGQTIVDVAITGTYFTGATSVSFGAGISVDSFTVSSATQILATITISPAAMPGARDVSVTAPGGTACLTDGFTVASASPTVTLLNPNQAGQGQTLSVTISGTYLIAASSVSFGADISVNSYTVDSDTQITANITVGPEAAPGLRDVSVTTPGGTATLTNAFNVTQAPPGITSASPSQGIQGQTLDVTITGARFIGSTSVSFGADITVNSFTIDSNSQITASITISSSATPGARTISVTSPTGTGTLDNGFILNQAPPTIVSVSPNQGTVGETLDITITGTYLTGATLLDFGAEVTVNSFNVDSPTQITVNITIDAGATPGLRDVSVTTPGGTQSLANGFYVSQGPPAIGSISPTEGLQEETLDVTITGDCFSGATSVSFGPEITVNDFTVDSPMQITVNITISPSATAGLRSVSVVTPDGTDTLIDCFTVNQAPPSISSVAPDQGVQEQTLYVTITGGHFIGATSVSFGPEITVNSFVVGSATQITASITINTGAALGFRDVSVTTAVGTATASDGFTVNESTAAQTGTGWYEQSTSQSAGTYIYGQEWKCQTFTPSTSHYFNWVSLYIYKTGKPTYTVTLALYNVDANHQPVGTALASTSFAAYSLTTAPTWREYVLPIGYDISAGTEYALVISGDGGDTINRVLIRVDTEGGYVNGQRGSSTDGGTTWQMLPDDDMAFKEGQYNLYETFTSINPGIDVYGLYSGYQTFTPSISHYFDFVYLNLFKVGKPTYTVTLALYEVDGNHQPTGTALCSTSFAASSLSTAAAWRAYRFTTGCDLLAGTEYALVISGNGGTAAAKVTLSTNATGGYSAGEAGLSADGGATWQTLAGEDIVIQEGQYPWNEQALASNTAVPVYGSYWACQTFTPVRSHYFNYVSLYLYRAGTPTCTMTISVYDVDGNHQPTGTALCSTTFAASSLTTKPTWRDYWFSSGCALTAGTEYALVLSSDGGDVFNRALVRVYTKSSYVAGQRGASTDNGTTWTMVSTQDMAFRECESMWYDLFEVNNAGFNVYSQNPSCQTFTPSRTHYLDYVSLALYKIGSPTYTITIALHNVDGSHQPTGAALSSTTVAASSLTTAPVWREYRFESAYQVSAGTEYALVISGDGGSLSSSAIIRIDTTGGYDGGQRGYSTDDGATWQMLSGDDMAFKEGQHYLYELFTSATLGIEVNAQSWTYQTFTPARSHRLDYVSLCLYKQGVPSFTVTVSVYATDNTHQPAGPALSSTTFPASSLTTKSIWREYRFGEGYQVSAGTEYAIVISGDGGDSVSKVIVRTNATGGYAAGECGYSTDGGAAWQSLPGEDITFKEGQYPWYEQSTLSNTAAYAYGANWACQTFTPSVTHYLNYVSLCLYKVENPDYPVTIALYSVDENHQPMGTALCSTSFAASSLTTAPAWYDFRFTSGCLVSAGTEYAIVLSSTGDDTTNKVMVRFYTKNVYAGGQHGRSYDSGTTWLMLPAYDMAFKEGGWL
ncbi:MAG: IPT/TIG domain-containing protein [Dehalococcoidia bacterium]|nr:IPT/TIG domain-containing protein [Dehalococcoidia bacterium]